MKAATNIMSITRTTSTITTMRTAR